MITVDDIIYSIREEERIIIHLFEKIPGEKGLAYQPTPAQRTTYELLQYIAHMPRTMIRALSNGDFSHAQKTAGAVAEMKADTFPVVFADAVQEAVDVLTDRGNEGLQKEQTLMGIKQTMGRFVLNMLMKNFTAYRMQLFLYAKQAGNSDLGTMNLWMGKDADT